MDMIGKVINHPGFGLGVICRSDRFGRFSMKAMNGMERGPVKANDAMSSMLTEEQVYQDAHVMNSLRTAGLLGYLTYKKPELKEDKGFFELVEERLQKGEKKPVAKKKVVAVAKPTKMSGEKSTKKIQSIIEHIEYRREIAKSSHDNVRGLISNIDRIMKNLR